VSFFFSHGGGDGGGFCCRGGGGLGWVVFGLAVVAVSYVGNLVGCGFNVWW